MNSQKSPVVSCLDDAIETAVLLIGQLNDQHYRGRTAEASLFARLRAAIEALPFDEAQACLFRQATSDSEGLAATNEPRAARWRMVQVARKLRTFRALWGHGPNQLSAPDSIPSGTMPADTEP